MDIPACLAQAGFPDGLSWGWAVPQLRPDALFEVEARAISRATDARKAEFTGGRLAARKALAASVALPMGMDRAPVWPEGTCGSITHAQGLCLAVSGLATRWCALGLDLEHDDPLHHDLIPEICLPEELAGADDPGLRARQVFSAKEAAYKALYPLTRTVFGFHGMSVSLGEGAARLRRHPETDRIAETWHGTPLPLWQHRADGLILSLCALPR